MAAVEFVASREPRRFFPAEAKVGARVAAECLKLGLIASAMPHGDILGFSPPLILSEADAAEIVSRAARAVEKVTRDSSFVPEADGARATAVHLAKMSAPGTERTPGSSQYSPVQICRYQDH